MDSNIEKSEFTPLMDVGNQEKSLKGSWLSWLGLGPLSVVAQVCGINRFLTLEKTLFTHTTEYNLISRRNVDMLRPDLNCLTTPTTITVEGTTYAVDTLATFKWVIAGLTLHKSHVSDFYIVDDLNGLDAIIGNDFVRPPPGESAVNITCTDPKSKEQKAKEKSAEEKAKEIWEEAHRQRKKKALEDAKALVASMKQEQGK